MANLIIPEKKIFYIIEYPKKISIYNFLQYLQLTSSIIHLMDNSFWRGLKRGEISSYNTALLGNACALKEMFQEVNTNQDLKQDFMYKEDLLLKIKQIDANETFAYLCPRGDFYDKLITSSTKYYNGVVDTKDQNDIVINACMLGIECGVPLLPEEEEILYKEGERETINQLILKLDEKINKLRR